MVNAIIKIFPAKSILFAIALSPESLQILIANSNKIDIHVIFINNFIKSLLIFDLFESLFIKSIIFLKVSNELSNIKAPPIITTYIAKSFLYCFKIIVNINVKKAIPITLIISIIN